MTNEEHWNLVTNIGDKFEAIREAIAELRKELEDATDTLLNRSTVRNAYYGTFCICSEQPSATQVFAAIHLAQAIDKVHAAEWSFGGELKGAKHEALSAIRALVREQADEENAAKAEEVRNA